MSRPLVAGDDESRYPDSNKRGAGQRPAQRRVRDQRVDQHHGGCQRNRGLLHRHADGSLSHCGHASHADGRQRHQTPPCHRRCRRQFTHSRGRLRRDLLVQPYFRLAEDDQAGRDQQVEPRREAQATHNRNATPSACGRASITRWTGAHPRVRQLAGPVQLPGQPSMNRRSMTRETLVS